MCVYETWLKKHDKLWRFVDSIISMCGKRAAWPDSMELNWKRTFIAIDVNDREIETKIWLGIFEHLPNQTVDKFLS